MEYASVIELEQKIRGDLTATQDKKSIALVYAFNATGKTRLSAEISGLNNNDYGKTRVLSYNAFLEDLFSWDNEDCIYEFEPGSWFAKIIVEQGIEGDIVDVFKTITCSKIEPLLDFKKGHVTFNISTGDDAAQESIKISRGEESVFVWSIFYTILTAATEALSADAEMRTTDAFNDLEFIVIDDPVSSIDDARIIAVAVNLFETIKKSTNTQLNFLITTHHALFYNVLHNSLRRGLKDKKADRFFYTLSKNTDNILKLEDHTSDCPFAYHLATKNMLAKAVNDEYIEKHHFNLFRGLLEKTANFLGYTNWSDCITGDNKIAFIRIVNNYSHSKLSELESAVISEADKQLFIETFKTFISEYKYQ